MHLNTCAEAADTHSSMCQPPEVHKQTPAHCFFKFWLTAGSCRAGHSWQPVPGKPTHTLLAQACLSLPFFSCFFVICGQIKHLGLLGVHLLCSLLILAQFQSQSSSVHVPVEKRRFTLQSNKDRLPLSFQGKS